MQDHILHWPYCCNAKLSGVASTSEMMKVAEQTQTIMGERLLCGMARAQARICLVASSECLLMFTTLATSPIRRPVCAPFRTRGSFYTIADTPDRVLNPEALHVVISHSVQSTCMHLPGFSARLWLRHCN
jgi:hypothetical protein